MKRAPSYCGRVPATLIKGEAADSSAGAVATGMSAGRLVGAGIVGSDDVGFAGVVEALANVEVETVVGGLPVGSAVVALVAGPAEVFDASRPDLTIRLTSSQEPQPDVADPDLSCPRSRGDSERVAKTVRNDAPVLAGGIAGDWGTSRLVDPQHGSVPADWIARRGQKVLAAQSPALVVGHAGGAERVVADVAPLVGGVAPMVGVVEAGAVTGRDQQ